MDVVRDSIENRADDACKAQAELRKAAIYPHSAAYAKEHGELDVPGLQQRQSSMQGGH